MSGAWDASHGPSRSWRSGAWQLELRDDELADLTYDGGLVLRSIRAVVRDRDWNTADLVVDGVTETSGCLVLEVHSSRYGAAFTGSVRVTASGDTVEVELELVAAGAFWTNRTGLVVLHPPNLAGADLEVSHADGSRAESAFPVAISAHQPVFDIAGLAWSADGVDVEVRFDGDVFEMEDQRNWTDASFKTYSRPLALPFPYLLQAGARVRQSVTVRAQRSAPASAREPDVLTLVGAGIFPEIALGASTAPDPAPASVGSVGSAVLVELDLATPTWRAALERAAGAGLPLDVRFVWDPAHPETLGQAASVLREHPVARVAAFDPVSHVSDAVSVGALRDALASAGVDVALMGGVRSHFTQLNREQRAISRDVDGVVFSITALFHSTSTEQLVESIAMQRLVAVQAVQIAEGLPVHVGPVTLRARFNDVATSAPAGWGEAQASDLARGYGSALDSALGDTVDLRQDAPELAAWTVASVAALAVPGVASIAYFEQWGPRGMCDEFGVGRPVVAALRAIADLSGGPLLSSESPDGLVWAVGSGRVVLVANLDGQAREATVRTPAGARLVEVPALGWIRLEAADAFE